MLWVVVGAPTAKVSHKLEVWIRVRRRQLFRIQSGAQGAPALEVRPQHASEWQLEHSVSTRGGTSPLRFLRVHHPHAGGVRCHAASHTFQAPQPAPTAPTEEERGIAVPGATGPYPRPPARRRRAISGWGSLQPPTTRAQRRRRQPQVRAAGVLPRPVLRGEAASGSARASVPWRQSPRTWGADPTGRRGRFAGKGEGGRQERQGDGSRSGDNKRGPAEGPVRW